MAIIHKATLSPTKTDLLHTWLNRQDWAPAANETTLEGRYRFDDPAGEVGIEGFILGRSGTLIHVMLTYRDAPLPGAEEHLVGTMEHSVLGTRYVHTAESDPVAVVVLERVLRGEQQQAELITHDAGRVTGRAEPDTRVHLIPEKRGAGGDTFAAGEVRIIHVLEDHVENQSGLLARWGSGEAIVAVLTSDLPSQA